MGLRCLGVSHARLAKAQRACDRVDLAAVSFERALSLSTAAKHPPGIVDALEGLGNCCMQAFQHRNAISLFRRALARNAEIKDRPRDARLYRALEEEHRRIVDEEHAKVYGERAEAIEKEMETKLSKAKASLEESTTRLVGRTANSAKVIRLQRVTAGYVTMCSRRVFLKNNLEETRLAQKAQAKVVKVQEVKLNLIREQLQEAQETDQDAMSSTLIVEGELMSFEIEELKIRLRERETEVDSELRADVDSLTALTNRVTNTLDELEALDQDIAIEGGPLMTSVVSKTRLRLIALNPANTVGNEVEGTATGGVEKVVAAEGKKVLVYGLSKGKLNHVFSGDEPGRHTGELLGHSGVITAIFFYKQTVYTGSTDCTVQVWDVDERKRRLILQGHEATVCSVVADEDKIVSGGADKEILIWSPVDGRILRMLHGHTKSVVSLHAGASFILSGAADGDIRLWGAAKVSMFEKAPVAGVEDSHGDMARYECKRRLAGHHRSATCVSYGRLELVSGHEDGTVIVWWASSGLIMMKSKVHAGPVRQLQFDATKVVSCSADRVIVVTDLTTGECTMTLRGHEGMVLAVAFDRSKVISASDDGTLRTWVWAARGPKKDKYAVLGPGDNLGRLAKKHNVTVTDIVKWNGVRDPRQLGVGVKLIVQKGNPDEPTAAELEMAKSTAISARRAQTIERSRALAKEADGEPEQRRRPKHTVGELPDPTSLNSRMARKDANFAEMWQEAQRLDIVSARVDHAADRSMAGRARERIRAMAKEAAMFDSDSDRDRDRELQSDGEYGDEEGEAQQDVLAKQARERDQLALDTSTVLLGTVVALMAEDLARNVFAFSKSSKGITGRVTNFCVLRAAEKAADDEPETRFPPIQQRALDSVESSNSDRSAMGDKAFTAGSDPPI